MIPLAKSLRPDQHRDLVDKQDAEQRALERPPSVEAQIDARFHAIANDYGVAATQKRAARYARENRPQLVRPARADPKAKAKAEAERVFPGDSTKPHGRQPA